MGSENSLIELFISMYNNKHSLTVEREARIGAEEWTKIQVDIDQGPEANSSWIKSEEFVKDNLPNGRDSSHLVPVGKRGHRYGINRRRKHEVSEKLRLIPANIHCPLK